PPLFFLINPLGLIAANGTVNTRLQRTFMCFNGRWMAAGCHKWADSKICLCMADKKPAGAGHDTFCSADVRG
ncbi:hypothetical protein, partial [Enterobacter roggenkampii]|uniref:hypothetical protein n=1 Tax=Enterobacter roggenkampii TaxID=1812935 RepID=UPI002FD81A58